jgi:hypothetical protein
MIDFSAIALLYLLLAVLSYLFYQKTKVVCLAGTTTTTPTGTSVTPNGPKMAIGRSKHSSRRSRA